jgi:hypothetical protein
MGNIWKSVGAFAYVIKGMYPRVVNVKPVLRDNIVMGFMDVRDAPRVDIWPMMGIQNVRIVRMDPIAIMARSMIVPNMRYVRRRDLLVMKALPQRQLPVCVKGMSILMGMYVRNALPMRIAPQMNAAP